MKKLVIALALLPLLSFSQTKPKHTISAFAVGSEPGQIGLSYEHMRDKKEMGYNVSSILNLSAGAIILENDLGKDITGTGVVVDLGNRTYLKKESWSKFYIDNYLTYGNIKFDEEVAPGIKYTGTYSYWSIVNPAIGYKYIIGGFSIDPSVGFNWKWEVKGKGDVDNTSIDNFAVKFGLRVGYSF